MDADLDAQWMALTSEEKRELLASRKTKSRRQRKKTQRMPQGSEKGSPGLAPGANAQATDRVDPEVWSSMTPQARKAHARRAKKKRARKTQRKVSADRSSVKQPALGAKQPVPLDSSQAWRFANYDRVRCNLGDQGWVCGNVQALDEPYPDGSQGTLPYVVMLDKPFSRLISVPSDGSHCVRPDVCFADGAKGGACAEAVAHGAGAKREAALRFAVGDRVACLTAGPDGGAWPRRWSAGTVRELWPTPRGAAAGAAVPYAIELDSGALRVLAAGDDHLHVRSLDLQPEVACPAQRALSRFTVRQNAEKGWDENVDQQTRRVRKRPPPDSDSDEDA